MAALAKKCYYSNLQSFFIFIFILVIDLSHNGLNTLANNKSTSYPTSSNIMSLDLSFNNISYIEVAFFHPVQNVLKILNMSRNALTEINPESLGHIRKLYR